MFGGGVIVTTEEGETFERVKIVMGLKERGGSSKSVRETNIEACKTCVRLGDITS